MTKRLALMLMLLLPLMAGCLTDSGDDDDDKSGSGLVATDFIPLVNGAVFNYTDTTNWSWDTEPEVSTYTSTITGPVSKNNTSYYRMIEDYGNSWPDTSYVRISNNTMYMIETFWGMIATKRAELAGLDTILMLDDDSAEVEVPFINFGAATWNIYSGTTSNEYHRTDYNWTGKYLRRESVIVPAGTFANAAVFEITMIEETESLDLEYPFSETWQTKMTIWVAENVGWVKSSVDSKSSHDGGDFMDEYTEVSVLNSYSIP